MDVKDMFSRVGDSLSNPLLLQYLSGAGAGLANEGIQGATRAVNNITQQNIQTQNYMKVLQKMLSGNMADGGKLTMDKDGMKISVPTMKGETMDAPMPSQAPGQITAPRMENSFSPFASGQFNFSASDLAGLDPQMISQALQFRMAQEELATKRISELTDANYKQKLMEYYDAQIGEGKRQLDIAAAKEERQLLELLSKDERTDLQKNYEYAKGEGFKGSIVDFKNEGGTPASYDEYTKAKEEGYKGKYVDFIKMKAQAGATNVNIDPFTRTMETGRAQRQLDVMSPDLFSNITNKLSKSEDWDSPAEAKTREEVPGIQKVRVLKEMDSQIRQAFEGEGKVERKIDGWYVNGKLVVRNPYAGR